ncbi:MAG TPA: molybdopterin cofactor-binding domain-containing protein [Azospirillaceae bacterium]|nr:molybdopterin cofactor-binding domain-containing protein [Azospirillaceae bacterium]
MTPELSRRRFLQAAAASGLTLGLTPSGVLAAAGDGAAVVNHWLHVGADGAVTVYSNAQEMGQGAMSGVAQLLADELRLDWAAIRVEQAPNLPAYGMAGDGRWAGGSSSIREQWDLLRKAGAAAREMLVEAGARRLGVPAADCRADAGHVVHATSGRRVAYGEVAAEAARLPVPQDPKPLPRGEWRLIGQPVARKDLPGKVDGSAVYAIDVRVPGMLSATIRQSPVFGGRLVSVDPAPALRVRGVRHVVPIQGVAFSIRTPNGPQEFRLADAVAVVASDWWSAKKGLEALSPVWDVAGKDGLDTAGIDALLAADLGEEGELRKDKEDEEAAVRAAHADGMGRAAKRFEADYRVPYLAHACMEPLSAAVHVRADAVEVWSGSQAPSSVQRILSGLTGIPEDRVTTHILYSGGAFGRRFISDFVTQAGFVSRAVGAPVKLVWSREEDLAQGRYRPASAARLTAGLDAAGLPTALRMKFASGNRQDFTLLSPPGRPQPDHAPPYYIAGGLSTVRRRPDLAVPTGPWRAPGSTQCAFFFESFVDELAHAAGMDPLAYRRRLLADNPRALRVLDAAAERAGWGKSPASGRGRGIAIWNSFQSIAAQVAEVSVEGDRLRVHKVTCAFDCGTAVNPDSVRAQGEGSILMALSATLAEAVTVEKGAVTSLNFDRYRLLRLAQAPEIEVVLLDSPDAPVGGAGEPMTPPLPPALANAIFAATGRRLRSLPLAAHGLTVA